MCFIEQFAVEIVAILPVSLCPGAQNRPKTKTAIGLILSYLLRSSFRPSIGRQVPFHCQALAWQGGRAQRAGNWNPGKGRAGNQKEPQQDPAGLNSRTIEGGHQ